MAFLDTLKSGLKSAGNAALSAVAPGAAAVKNVVSGVTNAAKNQSQGQSAASMAPVNSAPLGEYKGTPASDAVKPIGQTPLTNVAGGQTTKTNSGYVAPQMSQIPKGTVGTTATAATPKPATPAAPAAPAVNTQISGSNPFGNSNYTPTFSNPNPAPVAPITPAPTAPPATGYVNTPPPTANATSPTELSDLQKALLGTYNQTPEEKQAQDALQALAQQQADLSGAYRSGTNKIGEQPIVLDLLRGQQQALQKQYEGQVGALADQSKPLEVQLANLVANREQQNKALSAQYGFETENQKIAREAAAAKDEGFTLGEGQMRYDSAGNLIATGGEKSSAQPASIQEYQFAQQQGFQGGYLDYIKAKDAATASSSSTPSSYKEWELAGKQGTYADWVNKTGANKPLSGDAAKVLSISTSLPSDVNQLKAAITANPRAAILGMLTGTDTNLARLLDGVADKVGRLRSGGAINTDEAASFKSQIARWTDLPGGDPKPIIEALDRLIGEANSITQSVNPSGQTGQSGGDELDNILGNLGFKNASNSALKSSAVKSVKQDGQWGGQCGEFIHNIVADYPYGLNGINQKESIINVPKGSVPQVGDVVIQRVAGSTGHVAVVNSVDPKTGKITLTESNWNNNEKVSNNRTMSVNSPTISGYYRGSLAV